MHGILKYKHILCYYNLRTTMMDINKTIRESCTLPSMSKTHKMCIQYFWSFSHFRSSLFILVCASLCSSRTYSLLLMYTIFHSSFLIQVFSLKHSRGRHLKQSQHIVTLFSSLGRAKDGSCYEEICFEVVYILEVHHSKCSWSE